MPVAGRLRYYFNEWLHITNDKSILSWIKGYHIPFLSEPYQTDIVKGRKYTHKESYIIDECISDLLKSGYISPCTPCSKQFISPIFTVPKPNGKHRFILNLKELNKFIQLNHFKMEDYRTALKLIDKNSYMATLDLKDAYFLVPIAECDRIYLRFTWNSRQFNNQLFEFNVLPFGLCTAPYVFTKLLKPVLHHLRSLGHLSVNFLDDFLCIGDSFHSCLNNIETTKNILTELGFLINESKSQMYPTKTCLFLGFIFDSNSMQLTLPNEKKTRIQLLTNKLLNTKKCKIREFARYIGLLTSACPAVDYGWVYTKLFEREKFLALNYSDNYNRYMVLQDYLRDDFIWWSNRIDSSFSSFKSDDYSLEIFSDASTTGWGAACNSETAHGHWNSSQISLHINTLELFAAFYGLRIFASQLNNCSVLLRVDNTTAIAYINKMGGIQYTHLNNIARDIWQWCEKRNIHIFASYIQSKENKVADFESRQAFNVDTEWELGDYAFNQITSSFGTPEFDLFASIQNHKCVRYASWKLDPNSEIIDAFTFNWKNINFYAFPPFSLISKVLHKIKHDKAEGIVVVPLWPTQPWYPVWSKLLTSEILYFQPNENLLLSPFREEHPLQADLTLMAGRLSGNRC